MGECPVVLLKSATVFLASLAGLLLASPVSAPTNSGGSARPARGPVSEAEWKALLASHQKGGVIELGDRTVAFGRQVFRPSAPVTIRGGVFGPIVLDGWRNVTFDGATFSGPPGTPAVQSLIVASNAERLTIRNCRFTGYQAEDGQLHVRGPSIRNSQNVTIEGSTFENMAGNLGLVRSTGVRFRNNELRRIREGIQIQGGGDILIEGNLFEQFMPSKGDHPDAIQLFTTGLRPGEVAAHDIVIRNNLILAGGKAQGVFAGDEKRLGAQGLGYRNFTIENNVIISAAWHGITTGNVDGLTIRGNHLFRVAGTDTMDSRITAGGANITLEDNDANAFILADGVNGPRNRRTGPVKAAQVQSIIARWKAQFGQPS
jgi:hypothetical protein